MSPLPRPDALAVRPVASHAVLPGALALALFGSALRGAERVDVVRLGRVLATVPVVPGPALRLVLDASVDADAYAGGLRLSGPVGIVDAPAAEPARPRLVLPAGLVRAWGVGERAVVALGSVAVSAAVEAGAEAGLEVDRAVWIAAGRPATARWMPGVAWESETRADATPTTVQTVPRRVVTETDVRQARTKRLTIRLTPGQVVTPAAASLAREWGVFEGSAQPNPGGRTRSGNSTPS